MLAQCFRELQPAEVETASNERNKGNVQNRANILEIPLEGIVFPVTQDNNESCYTNQKLEYIAWLEMCMVEKKFTDKIYRTID